MIALNLLLIGLLAHFIGDFVLQRHAWSLAKSSSNLALGKHVGTYTLTLAAIFTPFVGIGAALAIALVNGALHFVIDWVTSRITKRLWAQERVHDFFVVIGLDQLLHMSIMALTLVGLE